MANFLSSEYVHIIATIVATYSAVRTWFAKEIKAGRAFIAEETAKVEAGAKKVENTVVNDFKKL